MPPKQPESPLTVLCCDSLPETLAALLRKHQIDSLLSDAAFIRNWPDEKERREQAELLIREAMYRHTIGRITGNEASKVFSILSFAMPRDYYIDQQ